MLVIIGFGGFPLVFHRWSRGGGTYVDRILFLLSHSLKVLLIKSFTRSWYQTFFSKQTFDINNKVKYELGVSPCIRVSMPTANIFLELFSNIRLLFFFSYPTEFFEKDIILEPSE